MHCQHLVSTFDFSLDPSATSLGQPRGWLAHLLGMDTNLRTQTTATDRRHDSLQPIAACQEIAKRTGRSMLA
jgi:hypothetical protein